jgi:hypothetical protein
MRRIYAGHSLAARLAEVPLRALERWIELRSLYRFTDKFHPVWRPRQLRMRSWLDLVPVGTAALTAEFGQRQLPSGAAASNSVENGHRRTLSIALRNALMTLRIRP